MFDDEVRRFLCHLHRGGAFGYYWTDDAKQSQWWPAGQPPAPDQNWRNIYFGVHPSAQQRGEHARAKNEDIAAINCLFAEFDAKDYGDKAAILSHLGDLAIAPSLIIDSGGGCHCYWLLATPFRLTNTEIRKRAKSVQAAWVAYVGGDPSAKDLARILRVPGSTNPKYEPPRPVTILQADYDRVYNLPDLETWAQLPERLAPVTVIRGHGDGLGSREDAGIHWLRKALDRAAQGNRNHTGFWLACQLRDAGLRQNEAEPIMRDYAAHVPQGNAPYFVGEALASLQAAYEQPKRQPAHGLGTKPETVCEAASCALDAPPASGGDDEQNAGEATDAPASHNETTAQAAPTQRRQRVRSADLLAFLSQAGYTFRLNECDDSTEVNGRRISDVIRAQIRSRLRDAGLGAHLAAADDAMTAHAARNAYHPVRAYLQGLVWDGVQHISLLADHVTDAHDVFGLYLRKWLIGAIARAYTGRQNAVFVWDGPQGIGKSALARWLCPLPRLFVDSGINPDDKDCALLAVRSWIWEVSELGATTRRADTEALKSFLSREMFTLRPPYGHFEITKPGLASFLGTVNNSSGLFADPTGSRRFWATTVTAIKWQYTEMIDIHQVWAEAHAAYLAEETSTLSCEEASFAREINAVFEVPDPIEDLLRQHFTLDPADISHWTSTAEILTTLQEHGLQGQTRANAMYLAAALKKLGLTRHEKGKIRGYLGMARVATRNLTQPI